MNRSKRDRMHPGLAACFPGTGIKDRVARALCEGRCIPRREFFESWSFVDRVRRHLDAPVVWDLCAGHGLVALLLALLEPDLERVRAIDRRKPGSFDRLVSALSAIDAERVAKVEFTESGLDRLEPPRGRVFFTAVHACGGRTDQAIDFALAARSSVALLPCCHDASVVDVPAAALARFSKRDAVDAARIFRLHAAGWRTLARRIEDGVTHCADAIIGIAPRAE